MTLPCPACHGMVTLRVMTPAEQAKHVAKEVALGGAIALLATMFGLDN